MNTREKEWFEKTFSNQTETKLHDSQESWSDPLKCYMKKAHLTKEDKKIPKQQGAQLYVMGTVTSHQYYQVFLFFIFWRRILVILSLKVIIVKVFKNYGH